MRVAIVGGGVMGCASALALAARGADVVLLERSVPGAEASSAAAGVLGAQIDGRLGHPMIATFARARAEYADWARELEQTSGIDVGHRVTGLLRLARTDEEARELGEIVAWHVREGLRGEVLGPEDARAIEPELSAEFVSAAWYPDEAQVDPPALLRALVACVEKSRVKVRTGAAVQRLVVESNRCVGVAVDGETLRADATVLAAGSWSSLVPGVPDALATVRPVRGQIVLLEERPVARVRVMVERGDAYLVPRGDGRVVCGSTLEHVGYARGVTAGGISAILRGVLAAVPSLAGAEIAATWSGLRPFAGDDTTWLVGASPVPGLFLATGHHRNGILLAKETSERVAAAVFLGVSG
jgi:glycine oxidase